MRLKRSVIFLVILSMVSVLMFASCDDFSRDNKESEETDNNNEKVESSVIVDLGADVPNMNSTTMTDVASLNVTRHTFDGLIRLDQNNQPTPGMAESWEISGDGLTYTFKLREAKWSNGIDLTAKDFEFGLKKLLEKENASQYAYILYMVKNSEKYNLGEVKSEEVGIKAIDDKTLEIILNRPTPYFLSILGFGTCMPVNEEFYNSTNGKYGSTSENLIFNGPWIIKEWVAKDKMVLEKNSEYWNAANINIDKITFTMLTEGSTKLNKFFSNEIDMIDTEPDKVELAKSKDVEAQMFGDGGSFYLSYNLEDKVLKNKKIREAISKSIDMETMSKTLLNDVYKRATGLTHPDLKIDGKPFTEIVGDVAPKYNAEEAKKLWNEGQEELGIRIDKLEIVADDSTGGKRDGQALQEFIKKALGVEVKLVSVPFKLRLEKANTGDFQILLDAWGPDFDDPITFLDLFHSKSGTNHSKYLSSEYDDLVKDANTELDKAKRVEILKNMEVKLAEDLPIFPMYHRYKVYLVKPELKGVVRNSFQDICLYWATVE